VPRLPRVGHLGRVAFAALAARLRFAFGQFWARELGAFADQGLCLRRRCQRSSFLRAPVPRSEVLPC
jgi:hypothetical protein